MQRPPAAALPERAVAGACVLKHGVVDGDDGVDGRSGLVERSDPVKARADHVLGGSAARFNATNDRDRVRLVALKRACGHLRGGRQPRPLRGSDDAIDHPVLEPVDALLVFGESTGRRQRIGQPDVLPFGNLVVFIDHKIEPAHVVLDDPVVIGTLQCRFREAECGDVAHRVRPLGDHVLEPHAVEIGADRGAWIDVNVLRAARRAARQVREPVEPLVAREDRARLVGERVHDRPLATVEVFPTGLAAREHVADRLLVHERQVDRLHRVLDIALPVRLDDDFAMADGHHVVPVVGLGVVTEVAYVLRKRAAIWIEVYEDEALPGVDLDLEQPEVFGLEILRLVHLEE